MSPAHRSCDCSAGDAHLWRPEDQEKIEPEVDDVCYDGGHQRGPVCTLEVVKAGALLRETLAVT